MKIHNGVYQAKNSFLMHVFTNILKWPLLWNYCFLTTISSTWSQVHLEQHQFHSQFWSKHFWFLWTSLPSQYLPSVTTFKSFKFYFPASISGCSFQKPSPIMSTWSICMVGVINGMSTSKCWLNDTLLRTPFCSSVFFSLTHSCKWIQVYETAWFD